MVWEMKEDAGTGKDKLSGDEEFYISWKTTEEIEKNFYLEPGKEKLVEEVIIYEK